MMTQPAYRVFLSTLLGLVLLLVSIFAPSVSAQGVEGNQWVPWFELGGKLSDELHNGEAELFVPLFGDDDSLLFVDFEGPYF